jgi:molecular chaperone DnaJ
MEVKAAFSVLSDPTQRADYDRRQRSGSWGGWRPGGGAGSGFGDYGWGGGSSGGATGAGPRRPKSQEEEFYGLVSLGGGERG